MSEYVEYRVFIIYTSGHESEYARYRYRPVAEDVARHVRTFEYASQVIVQSRTVTATDWAVA